MWVYALKDTEKVIVYIGKTCCCGEPASMQRNWLYWTWHHCISEYYYCRHCDLKNKISWWVSIVLSLKPQPILIINYLCCLEIKFYKYTCYHEIQNQL